jgi:hypothetical protein
MNRNKGKLSLEQTHELLDILEELEQIPHPMAEALWSKFNTFLAEEGFDESNFDPTKLKENA